MLQDTNSKYHPGLPVRPVLLQPSPVGPVLLHSRPNETKSVHPLPITVTDTFTSFDCRTRHPGHYADIETNCEIYHFCHEDGKQDTSECSHGTGEGTAKHTSYKEHGPVSYKELAPAKILPSFHKTTYKKPSAYQKPAKHSIYTPSRKPTLYQGIPSVKKPAPYKKPSSYKKSPTTLIQIPSTERQDQIRKCFQQPFARATGGQNEDSFQMDVHLLFNTFKGRVCRKI